MNLALPTSNNSRLRLYGVSPNSAAADAYNRAGGGY